MSRMLWFGAVLFASTCLLPPGAIGGEDSREAGLEKAKSFVETLKGFDAGLEGNFWYGVYFNGQKCMGKTKLTVARAPEDSGAVYLFTMTADMKFGDAKNTMRASALCDETLAMISDSSEEDDGKVKKTETVKKDGDHWVCVKTVNKEEDERKGTYRLKVDGAVRAEGGASWVFARRLPLEEACSYIFKGIEWPKPSKPGEEEQDLDSSAYRDVKFTIAAAAPYKHRGKEVQAHKILAEKEGDEDFYFYVDAERNILAWGPEGQPVAFIAGTEEECGKDIEVPKGSADEETVKDAVMVYFKVVCKASDPDALDGVVDWETVRVDLAKLDPTYEGATAEEAASIMKAQFQGQPAAFPEAQLPLIRTALQVEIDGDKAMVKIQGHGGKPYVLKKIDDKWKIVEFGA